MDFVPNMRGSIRIKQYLFRIQRRKKNLLQRLLELGKITCVFRSAYAATRRITRAAEKRSKATMPELHGAKTLGTAHSQPSQRLWYRLVVPTLFLATVPFV